MLHIDIKKLGRLEQAGHRITSNRTQRTRQVDWGYAFVAVDDHSRPTFTQVYPDETKISAGAFVRAAMGNFAILHAPIQRVLTGNGISFRSALCDEACLGG